jgi:hypothetical protein
VRSGRGGAHGGAVVQVNRTMALGLGDLARQRSRSSWSPRSHGGRQRGKWREEEGVSEALAFTWSTGKRRGGASWACTPRGGSALRAVGHSRRCLKPFHRFSYMHDD